MLKAVLPAQQLSVKRSRDPYFMYTAAGREGELLPDGASPTEVESMLCAEFMDALSRSTPPYLYFTSPVDELDRSGSLGSRAPGWMKLASHSTASSDHASLACRPWLQLWAGSSGACTQAHYDVADNVFVQVHGVKEFLLYPPSASAALHLFPDAHPRARKAQVCLEHPDLAAYPLAATLQPPLRATLQPGDALFVPAFTIHHVTAHTPSISLNVFSESATKLAASEVRAYICMHTYP